MARSCLTGTFSFGRTATVPASLEDTSSPFVLLAFIMITPWLGIDPFTQPCTSAMAELLSAIVQEPVAVPVIVPSTVAPRSVDTSAPAVPQAAPNA
jgi:hypothetical protein